MRLIPTQMPYCGLTVVLAKPSRFDPVTAGPNVDPSRLILSSEAGRYFDESLVKAGFPNVCRDSVEVRLLEDIHEPFLAGTKCVLCLGEECVEQLVGGVTLGEQRGSPVMLTRTIAYEACGMGAGVSLQTLPFLFSYAPQDAQDRQAYFEEEEDEGDEADNASDVKSTHGKTKRREWRWWLRRDVQKAVRISQKGLSLPPEPNYHLWPKLETLLEVLKSAEGKDFFFDWETSRNLLPTCVGFSFDAKDIYVAPLLQTHLGNSWFYGEAGTAKLFHAIGVAMLRNTPVVHHALFDLFVSVWRLGIPLPKKAFCTMISWNKCYVEQSKSLGHVISALTDLPYHKNEGVFEPHNHDQAEALYRYNGKDVFALTQIKPAIMAEAAKVGSIEHVELGCREVIPYLTMTLQGIRIDWPTLYKRVEHNDLCMQKIRVIINALANFPLNPNSSQGKWSVKNYLYSPEGLGIKLPAKDPTNSKTLLQVQLTHSVPIIPWILKYREVAKEGAYKRDEEGNIEIVGGHRRVGGWLGFYPYEQSPIGRTFSEPRLTTNWKLAATVTFRRASSKLLRFTGQNIQNCSKDVRVIGIADEGKMLGRCDESGADAMIVAYNAEHGNYRDLFINKVKPHAYLALHLFKSIWKSKFPQYPKAIDELCASPIKLLTDHPQWKEVNALIISSDTWPAATRYYYIAKMIVHAASYAMGPRMFRLNVLQKSEGTINLSNEEAVHFLAFFHELFREIKSWHLDVQRQINRTRMLRNRFNHPRVFTGWMDDAIYREGYAYDPQSTVAQIIAYAITELHERQANGDELLNDSHFDILQDEHDAILWQADYKLAPLVGVEVQKHINRRLVSPRGEEFFMRSGLELGDTPEKANWSFH